MKLTPLDIKRQEFKNTFRGYDPMEVETFLEMVADEYEELANERNKFKDEILTLQTQLKDYQQVEQTLKQTLMNAQESVNRARVNTEKEANLIIHEAELKAEKFLEKSRRDLETMKNELIIIRAQKESFAKRLKHLLESQIELIKVLEIDDSELGLGQVEVMSKKADEIIENVKDVLEVPETRKQEAEKIKEPDPVVERPPEVDLLTASSVPVSQETASSQEEKATDKLEEFLQKKEGEEQAHLPTVSPEEASTEKASKPMEGALNSSGGKQPATLEEFFQEQSEENPQIPDGSVEEPQVSPGEKREEPTTQRSAEPDDLFNKPQKDQNKKRTYPDDDQMVF